MDKTVVVLVERKVKHPIYGKVIRLSKKFHAHDENNEFGIGDMVIITESRPPRKTKTWVVSGFGGKGTSGVMPVAESASSLYNAIFSIASLALYPYGFQNGQFDAPHLRVRRFTNRDQERVKLER